MIIELQRNLFTPSEVAEHLGVSKQTIWTWIRQGKLDAVKINSRNYRIELETIKKLHEKANRHERSNSKL